MLVCFLAMIVWRVFIKPYSVLGFLFQINAKAKVANSQHEQMIILSLNVKHFLQPFFLIANVLWHS